MTVVKTFSVSAAPLDEIKMINSSEEITENYSIYLMDESKVVGKADYLCFPRTEAEVVAIVNYMRENNIPITISAARTGIVGSAVPNNGCVMSLERMNKIIGIGYDEEKNKWFVRVQPAVTLAELNDVVMNKRFTDEQSLSKDKNYVEEFKKSGKYFYPVDPTETSATICGTIATNASGARTFRYGPTRDWVKRIRVVLYTGDILDIERGQYFAENNEFIIQTSDGDIKVKVPTYEMPKAKNAAGLYAKENMDLIDLFIGSEGIFGVITEAEVWLEEYHPHMSSIMFFKDEADSLKFVVELRSNENVKPEFIEYMDANALDLLRQKQIEEPKFVDMPPIPSNAKALISFDIPYDEEKIEHYFSIIGQMAEKCNSSLKNSWCAYEEREKARFKHFRHAVPEIVNNIIAERKKQYPEIHKLGTDMSVQDEYLEAMMQFYHQKLKEANLEYAIWGHIGNNHPHINILPRNPEELEKGKQLYKEFAKKAVEYGGSVSAEHGIGKIKREYLKIMYGEEAIEEMKAVKRALDPLYLFNRGNMFEMEEN